MGTRDDEYDYLFKGKRIINKFTIHKPSGTVCKLKDYRRSRKKINGKSTFQIIATSFEYQRPEAKYHY